MPYVNPSLTQKALDYFSMAFFDLLHQAHSVHRSNHQAHQVQASTLMSIKTGGCPEDCAYCPQSAAFSTDVKASKLSEVDEVLQAATQAKAAGATRFCMGAAWRNPKKRDMPKLVAMIDGVKQLGLESCMTLGMLEREQAQELAAAGLDYYNHNLDTSEDFYKEIITTRTYDERMNTLQNVRDAGMKTCCGGIVGMGETRQQRAEFLATLASLPSPPESVPINLLVQVEGTKLAGTPALEPFEFVRTIAVARLLMPASYVRLSAGREHMDDALQALCFYAGANSLFYGDTLLTTSNPQTIKDQALLAALDLRLEGANSTQPEAA